MARKQHLLAVTHWLLKAATGITIFAGCALLLALGALGVAAANLGGNHLGMPAMIDGIAREAVLPVAAVVILAALVCVGLTMLAFLAAARIVKTAISGDPFVTENARRLTDIGWLLLAVQLVGAAIQIFVGHLPKAFHGNIQLGFDFSPTGILAILLVFVLAQIFRHGSEMREELEGTV